VDPTAHNGSLTTRRRQMATDDPVATDDDEGGCRGYTQSIINTVGPNSVNNLNHDDVAKIAVDNTATTGDNITQGPLSASPRITRVASPVLAKDFAQLNRDVSASIATAQISPKPILKNSSKKGGKHRHKHHHKHRHHHHSSSSNAHKDVNAAIDADVEGDGDNATTTRGRQSSITVADERSNIKTETKANTTANATSPTVTPTINKTTFSPLANPLIGKALKSLVRSSSEPGTPRGVAGSGTAGSRRGGVPGPSAGTTSEAVVDSATSATGLDAEKATYASVSDEKAALAGEKVFTVGEHNVSTRKTHHSNSMPPSSTSRKYSSGVFNNTKDSGTGAGAGGSLPLARSSEPHLPTSRTGFEEYEDLSDYPPVNHNLHSHHHGHGHQQEGGAAPGVGLASGGTGPPIITFEGLLEPEKPLKPPPTWRTSAWNICTYSWLNVMLVL
jgi:hypothetical protein